MENLRDRVVEKINKVLSSNFKYEGEYKYNVIGTTFDLPESIDKMELDSLLSDYINIDYGYKIEFLIRTDGESFFHEREFSDEKCAVSISEISDDMCIKILLLLPDKQLRIPIPTRMLVSRLEKKSFFDLLRMFYRHLYSVTVEEKGKCGFVFNNVMQIAKASLFNVSMLCGENYSLVKDIEEGERISRNIRLNRKGSPDVPHREYNDDMVQYYMAGNSARIPKVQFLSYYNVLEFWFDKTYNDEKCAAIQKIITSPKFNHNNLNHYKKITEIFRFGKNKASENELLQSLLEKYLDINDFKNFLGQNDYYLNNNAHKISDTKFSLTDSDALLIRKLAKRIYRVRNAIVHSKESEEERYFPQDEKFISQEVNLVKYVSEQVIIESAKVI